MIMSDFEIKQEELIKHTGPGGRVEILETVRIIGISAFSGCENRTEIVGSLSDSGLSKYILEREIWSQLTVEEQADLFLARHGKPLLSAYGGCVSIDQVDLLGKELLRRLGEGASGKEYSGTAVYMTVFQDDASRELLKKLYDRIRKSKGNTKKSLSIINADSRLMKKLSEGETPENTNREEELVCTWMKKENKSISSLEEELKDTYGLKYSDLLQVRSKDGRIIAPFVIAGILIGKDNLAINLTGICEEAKEIILLMDSDSFQNMIKELAYNHMYVSSNRRKRDLIYPICRYADEDTMSKLIYKIKPQDEWVILLSDTKAAFLFAEKIHGGRNT